MPTYPIDIQDKLDALQALTGADRKPAELVTIYWPSPAGTKIYSSAMYTELPWWPDLAAAITAYFGTPIPITLTLIPDGTPFIDLPRAASISDDSIDLTFSDLDDEFSGLLMDYGEGIRTEVFAYWPTVDLLLSLWRGMLHQPKEMDRAQVKITATSGWRAPQMLVPKRPHATSCPFIFGGLLSSQDEIDFHKGCPYNVHIGGSIGVPGFTDCPRRVKSDCTDRLVVETFWPGFETRPDPIPNNQTKGPNLLARAIGNESNLNDPIRAIFGERYVKALNLLAFRNETNNNHPEDGFFAGLFEVGEGPLLALWEFRMMGEIVGIEHFSLRLGELGQTDSGWSPDVNSYSGTAHGYGRIQGEPDNATASDYSASIRALGLRNVRIYSDIDTYTEGFTRNRVWCLLEILANGRWGYGQDYPRFDLQSFIDTAAWCDENITFTDAHGNTFSGVRSTFNAEVNGRAIQQQVRDICTAGRLGIPFEFEGKDVIVPLKVEDVDDPNIPTFTDEGPNRNIVYDGVKSSLSWSVISDETMTNQWTVNFDEAANGGVDTQFIFGDQAQQLRAGRAWGDRSKRVVNKTQAGYGIDSAQEAVRFGNSLLYLGPLDSGGILNPFSVKFTTWYSEAFNVQNYKLIKVVNAKLQSRMAAYFTARDLEPYPDADYTCFRVMKYTRKGDLRVEIEAQQYATLEESPASLEECGPVTWDSFVAEENFIQGPGTRLEGLEDGGAAATAETITASDQRFQLTAELPVPDPTDLVEIHLELTDSPTATTGTEIYDWYITSSDISGQKEVYALTRTGAVVIDEAGPFPYAVSDLYEFRRGTDGKIGFYQNGVLRLTSTTTTPATLRLNIWTSTTPGGVVDDVVFCAQGDPNTFSAPRDLTAVVTAATGLVHFHWSPPSVHPELVTGYTLFEEDGTTVVMPTALVNEFEVTLAPGEYTYRLNATDGVTVSSFVSVTFIVPDPPPTTLGLIDRDTGNTLIDRVSGDTLESRIA